VSESDLGFVSKINMRPQPTPLKIGFASADSGDWADFRNILLQEADERFDPYIAGAAASLRNGLANGDRIGIFHIP